MAGKWQGMLLRGGEVNPSSGRGEMYHLRSRKGILCMRFGSTWVKELGPEDKRLKFQNVFQYFLCNLDKSLRNLGF